MKRSVAVIIFLFLIPSIVARSQVMGGLVPFVELGVKLGGDFQHISSPVKGGPGAVAGVYVRKGIDRFGVRLEALGSYGKYTTKYPAAYYSLHTPTMDTISKGDFQAIGVSVPLMVEYQITNRLQVLAGPQFRYLVSLSDNNGAYTKIYGKDKFLKPTDFSIVAGIELSVKKRIRLGARLMKGVTDVNNSTYYLVPKTWTSAGAQLTVSYKIM